MKLKFHDLNENFRVVETVICERHLVWKLNFEQLQVRKVIDALLVGTRFRVSCRLRWSCQSIVAPLLPYPSQAASIVGGLAQQKQERIMKHKPEIVVATPGRLWALMRQV